MCTVCVCVCEGRTEAQWFLMIHTYIRVRSMYVGKGSSGFTLSGRFFYFALKKKKKNMDTHSYGR